MWRALAIVLAGLLAGCAIEQPLSTDLVRDGADAIQRVKNECVAEGDTRALQSSLWRANLQKGKWMVQLGYGFCTDVQGSVRAADGETGCMVCVS
jgi:hypothetical protein